jgi:hypothetical protein
LIASENPGRYFFNPACQFSTRVNCGGPVWPSQRLDEKVLPVAGNGGWSISDKVDLPVAVRFENDAIAIRRKYSVAIKRGIGREAGENAAFRKILSHNLVHWRHR